MDKITATTADAYKLVHDGVLAFSRMEAAGICVDVPYVEAEMDRLAAELDDLEATIDATELGKGWRRAAHIKKSKKTYTKDDQLRVALYKVLKVATDKMTDSGKGSVNVESLRAFAPQVEGLEEFMRWRKLRRARNTFLAGVLREQRQGIVHPVFNMHLALTYRSSSDSPNFQNQPNRDPEIKKVIRRAFIARHGRRLVGLDYSGIETRVPCFYNSDPELMAYVSDPSKDMHRDMAAQNYKLAHDRITKAIRYSGKNECVFPWFYGDWPGSTGLQMWESAKIHKTKDGQRLSRHLKEQGLRTLPDFLRHHETVFEDFWGRRFGVYGQWREDTWKAYQRRGHVDLLTGFRYSALGDMKQITNAPIQGVAFHLLLWSQIEIEKELLRRKMESFIIAQIHDEILADVPENEVEEYIALATRIMTKKIHRHWDWINVPLEVEAEASAVDGNWFEMEGVKG